MESECLNAWSKINPDKIIEQHCRSRRDQTPKDLSTVSRILPIAGAKMKQAQGDTKHKTATA
jgi:hypothetical protein